MRRFVSLILAAGCTSTTATDTPLVSCVDCSPGAVRGGRMYRDGMELAANATGAAVRWNANTVTWLDADLVSTQTLFFDPLGDVFVDQSPPGVDPDGGIVTVIQRSTNSDVVEHVSLESYDATGTLRWRQDLGTVNLSTFFTVGVGTTRVFVSRDETDYTPEIGTTTAVTLLAFDRATGAAAWTHVLPPLGPPYNYGPLIVPDPAGGAILAGAFNGTIDFGGTTSVLVSNGAGSGYVVAIDDNGVGTWAAQLDGGSSAELDGLARGPAGELALVGSTSGVPAPFLGTTPSSGQFVALVDSSHTVRWMRTLGGFGPTPSVATDGVAVFVGGDGSVASLGAAGVNWTASASGDGGHAIAVDALRGDAVLVDVLSVPSGGPDGTSNPPPVVQPTLTFAGVEVDGTADVLAELVR